MMIPQAEHCARSSRWIRKLIFLIEEFKIGTDQGFLLGVGSGRSLKSTALHLLTIKPVMNYLTFIFLSMRSANPQMEGFGGTFSRGCVWDNVVLEVWGRRTLGCV